MNVIRPLILSFLILAAFSSAVFGQEFPEKGRGMGPPPRAMEHWFGRLHLSPEQVIRLQEIHQSFLRDTLAWRNDLAVKRFDLRDLLANPQADPNQVLAKQREVSDLEARIQERSVLYRLEMRKVLTPEQIKLLPPRFDFGGFREPGMMPGRGRGMGRE